MLDPLPHNGFPPRSAPPHRRKAFTLVELTVVILLLGIAAAVAAPRYSDAFMDTQLEATALEVAEDIRQTRQYAINHAKTTSLSFDNASNSYQSTQAGISFRLPSKITLSADIDSQTTLEFDPSGTPRVSGSPITDAMITLAWRTELYYVQIGVGTGRVWVFRELPPETDGSSGGS